MPYEFPLPDVGEGIAEAEVVRWLVNEGEHVGRDEPLVEIETDKAVVEVPSPVAGTLLRQGGQAGKTLHVGDILAVLDTTVLDTAVLDTEKHAAANSARRAEEGAAYAVRLQAPDGDVSRGESGPAARPLATPAVRRLARELGVELASVSASGPSGRITVEDIQAAAAERKPVQAEAPEPEPAKPAQAPPAPAERLAPVASGEDKRVPLRGLRRRIAESMMLSWRTIPHITGMDEVEVSELVSLRERLNSRLEGQGVHLSYLPLIVKAVVAALKQYPIVNACLDEVAQEIVYRHRYNIGIATATPEGLIVPVVHDADRKTLRELAREIQSLSEEARSRTIALTALQAGTFTITNFGSLGGWLGTPIIRPGEAAILGVGRIQDRPWVVDGRIEVRPVLALSFAADHRLIDGDISTAFVRTLTGYLNDPLSLFTELV